MNVKELTEEQIIALAHAVYQLEEENKGLKSYILQLQVQIRNRNGQLKDANDQLLSLNNFVDVKATIE